MSQPLAYALLSLIPAAALFAGYPRRAWAAGAAALLAAAAGAALLALAGPTYGAWAAAAWSLFGSLSAWAACLRHERERVLGDHDLRQTRLRRTERAAELARLKAAGSRTELEQKETLALYGMIKGLAEALSWEDIPPKLELAVNQYLGVSQFALYILGEKEGFHRLSVRHLENSPGASWATWERCLQERGLSAADAGVFESPERAVALPIHDGQDCLGYFYARIPELADPSALLAKTRTFVSELAFAFRRLRLFQEVEKLSETDGLTGVFRRGAFDSRIREESIRAQTFKTTFGLLLLDIDHFKELNDRYGHPFGDQVLRRVGEILNASVYDTDFVARYGGEEFVILMPRAEPAGVLRKAEAIRAALEAEKFTLAFETIRATVSIGIAHFPRDAAGPDELVARADAAMYKAKSSGRNRVVAYEEQYHG